MSVPGGLGGVGGIGGSSGLSNAAVRRIELRDGSLYLRDEQLSVKPSRRGFFIGCTFVTWEAWDELKRLVE